jgi:hypothetical protein
MFPQSIHDALQTREEATILRLLEAEYVSSETLQWNDLQGYSLLHLASFYNWLRLLEWLLKDALPEHLNRQSGVRNETPLHRCACMGHVSIAYRLLETKQVSWKILDREGMTPLQRACQCGKQELVLFLYYYCSSSSEKEDPEVVAKDIFHRTPLIVACAYPISDDRMHDMLIRLGSDPCAVHVSTGMTAPHYLAFNHLYTDLLRWMQKHPVNWEARNQLNQSILDLVENERARRYLKRVHWVQLHPYKSRVVLNLLGWSMWMLPLICSYITKTYSMSLVGCGVVFLAMYLYFGGCRIEAKEMQEIIYSFMFTYNLSCLIVLLAIIRPRNKDQSIIYITFGSMALLVNAYMLIRLKYDSPGYIAPLTRDQERETVLRLASQDKLTSHHYCCTCGCIRPLYSKHCGICHRCVIDMDHHCVVITQCIGRQNRRLFLACLVASLMCGTMVIWDLLRMKDNTPVWYIYRWTTQWCVFMLFVLFVAIMISWYILGIPLSELILRWKRGGRSKCSHPNQTQTAPTEK